MCAVANAPKRHGADGADRWVLVPGTLCTPQVFDPMLDRLDIPHENRHFIAASAPHTSDFEPPLKAAVGGGEIVCGFSLGAIIVAHNLAAVRRAKAIVLLAANPFPDPPENRINREAARDRIITAGAGRWIVDNWPTMSTDTGTAIRDFVVQMAEDSKDHITAQTELAASRAGAAQALVQTDLPLVFVTGAKDTLTPPTRLHAIAAQAKSASLQVLDGLGHFALLEDPPRTAQAVARGLEAVI